MVGCNLLGGRGEALCNDGGSNHQLVWLGDRHLGVLEFSGVSCQWMVLFSGGETRERLPVLFFGS